MRRGFDEGDLAELAESIKEQGLLQAVLVRPVKLSRTSKAKYQIIAGEGRYHAAKLAGLKEIFAWVRETGEEEALSAQLVELYIGMAEFSLSINLFYVVCIAIKGAGLLRCNGKNANTVCWNSSNIPRIATIIRLLCPGKSDRNISSFIRS